MNMQYDFKAARKRIERFTGQYRRLKQRNFPAEALNFLVEAIREIEHEIAEAHASTNAKMTTVRGSGHPVIQISNLVAPIVPQWEMACKEEYECSI